jgi:hypothetical protein
LKKVYGFKILYGTIIILVTKFNPVFLIFLTRSELLLLGIAISFYVALDYLAYHIFHLILAFIGFSLFNVWLICLLLSMLALYPKRLVYRLNDKIKLRKNV